MSSRSSDAAFVAQPASMRLPNELLDEVFKQVFAEPNPSCSGNRVAAPFAWNNVCLDIVKDSDAIACLDPIGAATGSVLSLVKTLDLFASQPLVGDAETGKEKEEDEGDEEKHKKEDGQEQDAPPARLPRLLHGPDDDETSTLPIAASVARILAKCVNLSSLTIDQHLESISCKVTADHDPAVMWPRLTQLEFAWNASFIDLLPVFARLSRLPQLTDLSLLIDARNEHDNPSGTMTQELVDKCSIQRLERLQYFWIRSLAETPIGSKAVLQLLSPHAPLREVTWAGYIPPGVCKQLSSGTSEIEDLTFTCLQPTLSLTNQLLPQLLELGRRPIKRLSFDVVSEQDIIGRQDLPPITDVLKNLPYGVRFCRATDMDSLSKALGLRRNVPTGGADFTAIKARPALPATLNKKGNWVGWLDGKPLLQVGIFYVRKESDVRFFGRFGNPDVEGDVTAWMLLDMAVEGDSEEE